MDNYQQQPPPPTSNVAQAVEKPLNTLPNNGQPPAPPAETASNVTGNQSLSQISAPQAPPPVPTTPTQPQPQPPPLSYQQPGFTQKEVKSLTWRAWVKLGFIILFIISVLGGTFFISRKMLAPPEAELTGDILLQARYQPVLWKDFGEVFEPIVKIPVYYPSEGFVKHEFLLDSGALVSSLPREEAKKMGFSLAKLPRSTFGGFGGTTSFAYKAETKIKLGEEEVKIPVVFTESKGTKSILGRSGFFEKYSIYFNSKREMIEIRK